MELLKAAQDEAGQVGEVVGAGHEVEALDSVQHRLPGDVLLEAGEARAGAHVLALREGDVLGGVGAFEAEVVGCGELVAVAVGGGEAEMEDGAGGNLHAAQLLVLNGDPEEALRRGFETQHLLDEEADARPVFLEA